MIPYIEGTVYFLFQTESEQNHSLSPGSFVGLNTVIEESCEEGYYKTTSNRIIICSGNGNWKPKADKLCLSKCVLLFIVYTNIFTDHNISLSRIVGIFLDI